MDIKKDQLYFLNYIDNGFTIRGHCYWHVDIYSCGYFLCLCDAQDISLTYFLIVKYEEVKGPAVRQHH